MIYAFVKKGSFQDSVSLMLISRKLSAIDDVEEVSVMMGTPANKALLESTGLPRQRRTISARQSAPVSRSPIFSP